MSKTIEKIKHNAEALSAVRKAIDLLKEDTKLKMDVLLETKYNIENELMSAFEKEGLGSIKTDEGTTCSRSVRPGIKITDELSALMWARDNHAVSINMTLTSQKLKSQKQLPTGFERVENAYISIRSPKKVTGEETDHE